jgi:hypothetical protein
MTQPLPIRARLGIALARAIAGRAFDAHLQELASVSVRVDDSAGWQRWSAAPNERDAAEIQELYQDALTAWRKNPMAKRIIDCITDYTLGDGLTPAAKGAIGTWLDKWWDHPKNRMTLRLPDLSDELSRAGDLFITLHRNPEDGLSYVRPIPKSQILRVETLDNDWETEIAFYEAQEAGEPKKWLSPAHPEAAEADRVMVHYAVNRVVGALMGEGDLATMIPWLLRYSRLLEDRVRLNFAARAFLWIVTVPTNMVESKRQQYSKPPDSGSVIVKDDSEDWKSVNPDLKGLDAQYDARAIRQMIDAGSGLPPHWRGEAHDVSLATARAMENSASRHLRRRQLYLRFIIVDLAHLAYTRAHQIGKVRASPDRDLIQVSTPDIARSENLELAQASKEIATALTTLHATLPEARSATFARRILQAVFKFAGQPLTEAETETIMQEMENSPKPKEKEDDAS